MRIAKVEWLDSSSFDGWQAVGTLEKLEPSKCVTVGWVLRETETAITLVSTYGENSHNDSATEAMCIPKCAVSAIVVMPEPTAPTDVDAS